MANSPWKDIAVVLPVDGSTVYIRRTIFLNPVTATWDLATATFALATGLTIPWWVIEKWRPL